MIEDTKAYKAAMECAAENDFRGMLGHVALLKKVYHDYPQPYQIEGAGLLGISKPKLAIESFQRALRLDKHSSVSWLGLANAYAQLKDWPQAILRIEAALLQDPQNISLWGKLRSAYVESGMTKYLEGLDKTVARFTVDPCSRIAPRSLYKPDYVAKDLIFNVITLSSIVLWFEKPSEVDPGCGRGRRRSRKSSLLWM